MIIGIGGISNAGKSSLANLLKLYFEKTYKVKILCQDDFIINENEIPKINGYTDWELPVSINHSMFLQAIIREELNNDIVISEGLFAYHDIELVKLYQKKIFLRINKNIFIERKKSDNRWGEVPDWYIEHIWDSYDKYGKAISEKGIKRIEAIGNFNMEDIIDYLDVKNILKD